MNQKDRLKVNKELAAVKRQLSAQSAVHGVLAEVFDQLGGTDGMVEWARDNRTDFYRMFAKSTPGLIPSHGLQGDINITVNPALQPTSLDSDVPLEDAEDAQWEDIGE